MTPNIVIPMAGDGTRFAKAGYVAPKPLIDVFDKPMVERVVENLGIDGNYIFIIRQSHDDDYGVRQYLQKVVPGCAVISLDQLTEGAACTVLLAEEFIDNDSPLIIANSDQFIEWDRNKFIGEVLENQNIDGSMLTWDGSGPKWSYAKVNDDGRVTEVAEKVQISEHATVGIYYWARGSEFVRAAHQMIQDNIRTNNEFYLCPVFNESIKAGKNIGIHKIDKMWSMGTPDDLKFFLENYKH